MNPATACRARPEHDVLTQSLMAAVKHVDPFAHLKAEFAKLMNDIYNDRPDPEMDRVSSRASFALPLLDVHWPNLLRAWDSHPGHGHS